MALSPAEKQRRYRERKKEAEKAAPDAAGALFKLPFSEFMTEAQWSDVTFALGLCGIDFAPFGDETSGKEIASRFDEWGAGEGNYDQYEGAVGRAELMIPNLIDAAMALAKNVNEYKRKEISDRIRKIETANLSDPAVRKRALNDIVRLKKMMDQLEKRVRIDFPQWKVTGV